MFLSTTILGRSACRYLTDRNTATVLRIGSDYFDRTTLAGLACYNFSAAANLSRVLNAELQVKNTRDLFTRIHPERLVLPQLGAISLAVLGAAFEAKGLGGPAPLEAWFALHTEKGKIVTFSTLKIHAMKARALKAQKKPAPAKPGRALGETRPHA